MFYGSLTGFGGGGAGGFLPLGADFDGTNDFMSSTDDMGFSGSINYYSFFFWVYIETGSSGGFVVSTHKSAPGTSMPYHVINSSRQFEGNAYASAGSYFYPAQSSTGFSVDEWHYVMIRFNSGSYDWKLWIDGVDQAYSVTSAGSPGFALLGLDDGTTIGANGASGTSRLNGYLAEFWMDDVDLDFDSSAVRDAFVLDGAPVDLGDDGSGPTGSQPGVYCSIRSGGSVTDFATNRGSGGNFTITGTLDLITAGPGS